MQNIIHINQLTKRYGDSLALKIDALDIKQGQTLCIIGPNGAGKTTLLRIISGLLLPSEAQELEVFGIDLKAASKNMYKELGKTLSIASDPTQLYELLTIEENLRFVCKLLHLKKADMNSRIDEVLKLCSLTDHKDKQVWQLSTGLKQRANIARSLLSRPKILLMDEPTSGLDPIAAEEVYSVVSTLKSLGVTVLICTHIMQEVDDLADSVIFINHGQILAHGTPHELMAQMGDELFDVSVLGDTQHEQLQAAFQDDMVEIKQSQEKHWRYILAATEANRAKLEGLSLDYLKRKASLRDVFFSLGA